MGNCIITGGSGFIGTHLIRSILASNLHERILVLDLQPPKISHPKVSFKECDIREPIRVTISDNFDTCYHLAALCKEPGFEWDEYFRTNHEGTVNVSRWLESTNVEHLIFTSTMMVYRAGEKRYDETSLTAPNTAYGISKLLAEQAVNAWSASKSSRRAHSVRMGVVFGQWEDGNYTRLYHALKKRTFVYIGKNNTVKSSIYVKDAVAFLLLLRDDTSSWNEFNLAYKDPLTIKEICTSFMHAFEFRRRIPTVPYSLALSVSYVFEFISWLGIENSIHHRRIQKLYQSTNIDAERAHSIGYRAKYSLIEALEDWKGDCLPDELF